MIEHTSRIQGVIKSVLKEHALSSEQVGFNVSQAHAPVPNPAAPPGPGGAPNLMLGPAWVVTVTMRNPLLGMPDIGFSVPVAGVLPPDSIFTAAVTALLDRCRQEKDKALNGAQPVKVKAA